MSALNRSCFPFSKGFCAFLCTLLSLTVLSVPILLWILPSSDFSEDENRPLTSPPTFSADNLFSGEYTDGIAAYLRDHLPARSILLKTKATTEYAALKRENNRVIAAKNGYLIKRFEYTDTQIANFGSNLFHIEALSKTLQNYGKPVAVVCAPRAIDVLHHLCPNNLSEARPITQYLGKSSVEFTDVTSILKQKAEAGEKVWYRTDHHWSTLGAYYAYTALGDALGYSPFPRAAFSEVTVCEDFLGTSYSACLMPICRADRVTAMRYDGDDNVTCTDQSTGVSEQGFYREKELNGKDKYRYFLGPNTAHVRIVNHQDVPRPTLLVIKDSYAQCLVPFLARHFDIELIDLRYFRTDATDTLREIVSSPRYAGTLILCNIDTLTGDAGFGGVSPQKLR